jgi:very-short-patch-repair endonuclease
MLMSFQSGATLARLVGEPKMQDEKPRFKRTREETLLRRKLKQLASKTEKKLWPHLRADRMGAPFRRQYSVSKYFADYACLPLKLVVEIDGPMHEAARDSIRDHRIERRGFDVIRFGVQEIDGNLDGVISTIYDAVQLKLMARRVKSSAGTR